MNIDQIKLEIDNCQTASQLETIRIKYLGRSGLINHQFSKIKTTTDPKTFGQQLNQLKTDIEQLILTKSKTVSSEIRNLKLEIRNSNFCLPKIGHLHPITQTERQLNQLFQSLGFSIYDGPIIETDEFNFQRLNVPPHHPARDMQDTIYVKEPTYLLRSQTSAIEAHILADQKPPFRVAFPGSVFRNEKVNRSNHFTFHQYQAVVVEAHLTVKDLIGTMDLMFKTLYGPNVIVRYRSKYYPEVEPGIGPDMQCFVCHGTGCSVCKGAGWIEMGGSGIIHPLVLSKTGIDPDHWQGFAFGMGLDRWTMAKFNINDIRTLTGGNLAYKPNSL